MQLPGRTLRRKSLTLPAHSYYGEKFAAFEESAMSSLTASEDQTAGIGRSTKPSSGDTEILRASDYTQRPEPLYTNCLIASGGTLPDGLGFSNEV